MPTQLIKAREGKITDEMNIVAQKESKSPEYIRQAILRGEIVIVKNRFKNIEPLGVGKNLKTKVNANIGSSMDDVDINIELEKLKTAVNAGADAVMDLSTGGDITKIREAIIKHSPLPVGTVPIYQAAAKLVLEDKHLIDLTADDLFDAIEMHAKDGVDFITVHCGITKETINRKKNEKRLLDIVSRGGAIHAKWIEYHKRENPLYERFDDLVNIARNFDITLSLGDGCRPGALADATDRIQVFETIVLGELAARAHAQGVQVMIEGPGHMPIDQIDANIKLQKRLCNNAPFYVLGPLVTDIAPGYDHITSAIGGAIASAAGADFLCYVTPAEHLRLPDINDVHQGVIATKIAAHAGDIAKNIDGARLHDDMMAKARKNLDWEKQFNIAIDPLEARKRRAETNPEDSSVCTMCSSLCSIKTGNENL